MYRSISRTKFGFVPAAGLMAAVVMGGTACAQSVFPQVNDPYYKAGQARLVEALKNRPNTGAAKNIIVFLGDGMGVT